MQHPFKENFIRIDGRPTLESESKVVRRALLEDTFQTERSMAAV